MPGRIPLLGEAPPEPLTVLYDSAPPVVPGALFTASAVTRLRQVVVRNVGQRPAELSLQLCRRGGQPGDGRALILADRLTLPPGAAAELVGQTADGYQVMWRGDALTGCQETAGALAVLAYGT